MKMFLTIFLLISCISAVESGVMATANIHLDSSTTSAGTILFDQREPNAPVRIVGIIDGMKNNTVHGFHIHRDALMGGELNCSAAGPHYNPYNVSHGSLRDDLMHRHVGDLGNVTANDNGIIIVEIIDRIIDFYNSTLSVANRTVVLHAMRDDGGRGGFPDSSTTGDAGARIACGVISFSMNQREEPTMKRFFEKLFP